MRRHWLGLREADQAGIDVFAFKADGQASIGCVVPALDIVGSRIAGWDIKLDDTIADIGPSALGALGQAPKRRGDFAPRPCDMVTFRNSSRSRPARGRPAWARRSTPRSGSPAPWRAPAGRWGRALGPGDVALSGALGPFVTADPGDMFEAHVNGLGSVRSAFGRENA